MRALLVILLLVTACDGEPPVLHTFLPDSGEDLRGIRFAEVYVEFSDESPTEARLYADGVLVGRPQPDCDDERCVIETRWDTAEFPIGDHELQLVLEDEAGHVTEATHTVYLDDVFEITSMHVVNVSDGLGSLEIEAYAFDDATNELIGCAGSRQNLGRVDRANETYALDAILIRPDGALLATRDFAGRRVRIEVWEDDDSPVCPTLPSPTGNERVGISEAHTADEWRQIGATSFGNVAHLEVTWSRRLTTGEDPGTVVPQQDPLDFGRPGPGCAAGGGAPWWFVALAALGLRRRSPPRA